MDNRQKRNLAYLIAIYLVGAGGAAFSATDDNTSRSGVKHVQISNWDTASMKAPVPAAERNTATASIPDPKFRQAIPITNSKETKNDLRAVAQWGAGRAWTAPAAETVDEASKNLSSPDQQGTGLVRHNGEMTWRDLNSSNLETNQAAADLPGAVWVLGSALIGLGLLERIRRL
jgi:hypothetical protein